MIANALILPTERPPSALDVKRALLSYDEVHIPSPDDRELIPPNTYQTVSTGMPPIFGISAGAVRPLGKVGDFDSEFERFVDDIAPAIKQGSVKILDAPTYQNGFTLGGTPIPPGTPDPQLTYLAYRGLCADRECLDHINANLDYRDISTSEDLNRLAPAGAEDSTSSITVNNEQVKSPFPPRLSLDLDSSQFDEPTLSALDRLTYAKIGALVRNLLRCQMSGLTPIATDGGFANVMAVLEKRTAEYLASVTEVNPADAFLRNLAWLQRVVISEALDESRLIEMSTEDVLRLRTRAWGRAGEARVKLANELRRFALDCADFEAFQVRAHDGLQRLKETRSDLRSDMGKLLLKSVCSLGMWAAGGSTLASSSLMQKIVALGSLEATVVLGCFGALRLLDKLGPQYVDLMRERERFAESPEFAIFGTYSPFLKK